MATSSSGGGCGTAPVLITPGITLQLLTQPHPLALITQLYNSGPLEGPHSVLGTVLWTWVAGSCWFTAGGCFLAYRHFVMGVV